MAVEEYPLEKDVVDLTDVDEYMLTTEDNPYDPFTEWASWLAYDQQKGYNTNGLLARFAATSKRLSDEENELVIKHAVNDILRLFPGVYKIVMR